MVMAIIIGVDPSLLHTGVSVWEFTDKKVKLKFQTTIENPSGSGKSGEVLPYKNLYNSMKAVLGEFKPQVVFSEKMFASKSGVISEMLFNSSLMVRLAAHDLNIEHRFVPITGPMGWQTFMLQGDRVLPIHKKRYIRKRLETNTKTEFKTEHSADAGAIGITGWYHFSGTDYRAVLGLSTEPTNVNHVEERAEAKRAGRAKRKA